MFTRLCWDSWTENWELWLQELSRDAQQLFLVCQDDLTKQHGWSISMNFWQRIKSLRYFIKLGQWCEKKKLVKMLILVRWGLIVISWLLKCWRHYYIFYFSSFETINVSPSLKCIVRAIHVRKLEFQLPNKQTNL